MTGMVLAYTELSLQKNLMRMFFMYCILTFFLSSFCRKSILREFSLTVFAYSTTLVWIDSSSLLICCLPDSICFISMRSILYLSYFLGAPTRSTPSTPTAELPTWTPPPGRRPPSLSAYDHYRIWSNAARWGGSSVDWGRRSRHRIGPSGAALAGISPYSETPSSQWSPHTLQYIEDSSLVYPIIYCNSI